MILNFLFMQYFLLEYNGLISCKHFMMMPGDYELKYYEF